MYFNYEQLFEKSVEGDKIIKFIDQLFDCT